MRAETWTAELIGAMRHELPQMTTEQFARKHGLTKGQVIGKAQRLGVRSLGCYQRYAPVRPRAAADASPRKRARPEKLKPAGPAVDSRRHCMWPIAGAGLGIVYCRDPVLIRADGRCSAYCPDHHVRAHVPQPGSVSTRAAS